MKITDFLEGDTAGTSESECGMMNKSAPTALRTSNRHIASKDLLRRAAVRKEWKEKDTVIKKEDLLTNLPQDMMREILGRLPIKSLMRCKCVCESWRHLIEGGDFATSYTPKPGLAFTHRDMGFAVCDEAFQPLFRFSLPRPHSRGQYRVVIGSVNGLLLVRDGCDDILFICNPMTREYVELPPPTLTGRCIFGFGVSKLSGCIFGFGVSKLSGQYKILCGDQSRSCHVYTLGGEGLWRSISAAAPGSPILLCENAAFLNGNLHWLASDFEENPLVCCFDLQTELFTSFSLPPRDHGGGRRSIFLDGEYRLCILEGRLCSCDISNCGDGFVIWWMNNYGDENSWVKEYIFDQRSGINEIVYPLKPVADGDLWIGLVFPLKVLANGDLWFAISFHDQLFIYKKDTADFMTHGLLQRFTYYSSNIAIYTPSWLSLTSMGIHNVQKVFFRRTMLVLFKTGTVFSGHSLVTIRLALGTGTDSSETMGIPS